MNIKIDDDVADKIIIARLTESARNIKDDLAKLLSSGGLQPYQKEDVKNYIEDIAALNRVLEYFGSEKIDWTGYVPIECRDGVCSL
jgi:hypothetical protein